MSEINYKELATALAEALKENNHVLWIDPETHAEHHQFVAEELEKKNKADKLIDETKAKMIGWAAIGTGGGIITFIGWAVIRWLEAHGMKF